jgi:hypothetical protein
MAGVQHLCKLPFFWPAGLGGIEYNRFYISILFYSMQAAVLLAGRAGWNRIDSRFILYYITLYASCRSSGRPGWVEGGW